VKPYRGLAMMTFVVILIGTAFGLAQPWPWKFLIDNVLQNEPLPRWLADRLGSAANNRTGLLVAISLISITLVFFDNVLGVLNNYITTKLQQYMVLDFRSDLFDHAQRLSLAFHDQKRTGPLIYAINFQADAAAGIVLAIPPIVESLLTIGGMFVISFMMNSGMALLSLAVLPFLYVSVGLYAKHIEHRLQRVKEMEEVSLSIIHEAISMLRVIVAFGREPYESRRFRAQGREAVDARVNLTVRQTVFSLIVKMVTGIGLAMVLGYGGYQVIQGNLTVGQLLVIYAYIGAVYKPLEALSYTFGSLQNNMVNLKMASKLLDLEPEIQDKPGAVKMPRVDGRVEFANVSFSYSGRVDTLTDINFTAEAGQVVAIVGPTGAGKTTLVSLMPRFYAPSGGTIRIDGRDITEVTLDSLRDNISMVLQEPMLFSGTIAENIRYGRLNATQDEIIKAAQDANAHDFIMRLPNQYQTQIGERGAQLSGGERQRICVARAFLKDAPILILDEPTSSIDSKTEAVILDALDLLMEGRTTFMIAHRLSTVRRADKILVMDQGKLIEQGRHEELIELGGLYKQLHDVQIGYASRARQRRVLAVEPSVAAGQ
jgi:ABC-type multidrug transport system fused ATPase/permease subunit